MDNTRDVALRAFTTIENHIRSCDVRYEEYSSRQNKTLDYLETITKQMSSMKEDMAEARGAGKMAKLIIGGIGGAMGFVGGVVSHIVK